MMVVPKELPTDLSKALSDWALSAGRYLQSEQTGYVHDYYGETEQRAQTIPLVENALFALALLRSRLVEQIQEGKVLLKGLLAFQNLEEGDSYGNFPIYLHAYPICKDLTLGLQLLAPFYWILKQFGHVLGLDLRHQLEKAAHLALEHSLRLHTIKPFPYSIAVRLAAAQFSFGSLWEQLEWQQEGNKQLEQLAQRQLEGWYTTTHLGDLLVGLQMAYPSLANSQWNQLWHRMEQTWHHQMGCYMGPYIREWQEREEPQTNLYDLFGGYFARQFSQRAILLRPYHLYGALIQPSPDRFDINSSSSCLVEGRLKQQAWQTVHTAEWAYTVLEKKEPYHPSVDKTYTPFRLIWGDRHRVHSLVCQGGCYEKVEYNLEKQAIQLVFDLRDNQAIEESNQKREIEFFVDFHPNILFTLNGHTTMTFELGQKITLSLGKHQLSLVFDLLQGEGTFLGHVMRSNRPSQAAHKGGRKSFQAYDWTFFLRTIRRQGPCRIRASLWFETLKNVDS
jgi:hypothetical protein